MKRLGLLLATLLVAPALVAAPASAVATPGFAWGSDVSPWWSYLDAERGNALSAATTSRMTVFGTDAKDGHGYASWQTPNYKTFGSFGAGDGGLERAVRDAHAKGLYVVARFDMFEDTVASQKYPHASLGGSPTWVDPGCADVRSNLIGMLKDMLQRVPVDEVNFDHVRYPVVGEASASVKLPCTGGTLGTVGADRTTIIANFVRDAAAAARSARPGVKVSASLFPETMHAPLANIGQDASKIAPHVDVIMPMTYPDYWWAGSSRSDYQIVYDNVKAGVSKFGGHKIRPWVQGDAAFAGSTSKVCEEVKGAKAAGASGAMVWWFPSMGTSGTTWKSIADCAGIGSPSSAPAPAPAPAPGAGAFAPTFTPKPGNNWWVEVALSSDRPVETVTASVNGGSPHTLAWRSWGAWAASFHAPTGSKLTFTAIASDGSKATSGAYLWPSATPAGGAAAPSGSAAVTFTSSGNEWWVQTKLGGADASKVAKVEARDGSDAWKPLTKRDWGAWAASFHVTPGRTVEYRATLQDGRTVTSCAFAHPAGTCASGGALSATFTKGGANEWWVEVKVRSASPISGVTASVDGGVPIALSKTSWGTWAKSTHVSPGSSVRFTARAADGATAQSQAFPWP